MSTIWDFREMLNRVYPETSTYKKPRPKDGLPEKKISRGTNIFERDFLVGDASTTGFRHVAFVDGNLQNYEDKGKVQEIFAPSGLANLFDSEYAFRAIGVNQTGQLGGSAFSGTTRPLRQRQDPTAKVYSAISNLSFSNWVLAFDTASGSDFTIGQRTLPTPTPTPTPAPTPTPTPSPCTEPDRDDKSRARIDERFSGTINPGQNFIEIPFEFRRSILDAMINQNHGNERLYFELYDNFGNLVAVAENKAIYVEGLQPGRYRYRVSGTVSRAVDFTIKSRQSP